MRRLLILKLQFFLCLIGLISGGMFGLHKGIITLILLLEIILMILCYRCPYCKYRFDIKTPLHELTYCPSCGNELPE